MHKSGFAEWLLRRAADDDRGSGIYGDLLEMAAARGRAWFWFEYARTLVALTWRTMAGFALGFAVFAIVAGFQSGNDWQRFVLLHFPHRWRRIPYGLEGIRIYNFFYGVLSAANITICLLASYAAVRYGLRDKMVRAALALGLMLTSAMAVNRAWPVALSLITLAVLTTVCSLLVSEWRGPFATVAASLVVGMAASDCLLWTERVYFLRHGFPRHDRWLGFAPELWAILILDMALLVAISARFRRLFVKEERIASL